MNKVVFVFLFATTSLHGQNLVVNGNFEGLNACPLTFSNIIDATGVLQPSLGTSDCFNACTTPLSEVGVPFNFAGIQSAYNGNGYAGLFAYSDPQFAGEYREYIQIPLSQALVPGKQYTFSMQVSLAGSSGFVCDGLGVALASAPFFENQVSLISIPPLFISNDVVTDTTNWKKIEYTFIATQSANSIIIGNYLNDANQLRYANPNVHPINGLIDLGSYYYVDEVSIIETTPPPPGPIQIPDVFTPNTVDGSNDVFKIANLLPQSQLIIYNRWGTKVYESDDYKNDWNGGQCSAGVYFYILHAPDGKDHSGTITIL